MKKIIFFLVFIIFETHSFSQQTIFLSGNDNKLYNINLNNCLLTIVNDSPAMPDIAVTPDGNLWGYNGIKLWSINQTSGQTTQIANSNPIAGTDSLVALNNSTLLFESGQYLWALNLTNAHATILGTIGYFAKDFAWYDNNLFMSTDNGLLVKIILNESNSNVVSVIPVNSLSNPIPICEAIVTAAFEGHDNALVGFSENSAYKICPIDGSYTLLCQSLATQFFGADSVRLSNQVNPPINCEQILSAIEITASHYSAFPNPVGQNDIFQLHLDDEIGTQESINIFDLQGHRLISRKETLNAQNILFNMADYSLPKGIYIIENFSNNKRRHLKLIVQ